MSTTSQLQVYDALVASITQAPALADGRVNTMRTTNRAMPAEVPRQIRVFLVQSLPAPLVGGAAPVDWVTRIRVECQARDVPGTKALDAASLLAAQVQGRVLQNAALQAMASEVTPAPMQWSEDEADTTLIACQAIFTVVHRAPFSNLIA